MRNLIEVALATALVMSLSCTIGGTSTDMFENDEASARAPSPKLDLLSAIDQEKTDIIRQHMKAGTNPNETPIPKGIPFEGAYPLHLAVLKGNQEIARILLDNGADIDIRAKNKDEAAPLHWAAFFLQTDMVSFLIQSGASINLLDANKGTPLDAAAFIKAMNQNNVDTAGEIITILKYNGGEPATER